MHKVHEHNELHYDHGRVPLTGKPKQSSPSPPSIGMAPYENTPPNQQRGKYFNEHKGVEGVDSVEEPSSTGARNEQFFQRLCVNVLLLQRSVITREGTKLGCKLTGNYPNVNRENARICRKRLLFIVGPS